MFEFKAIGKVLKSYRKSGEMLLHVPHIYQADLEKCQAIFLEIDGLPVPFFIEYLDTGDDDTLIIKVEEINAPEEIRLFNGNEVFLRSTDLSADVLSKEELGDGNAFEDFQIEDHQNGKIYPILRIEQYPQQLMAIVVVDEKEVLIPLAEELIIEIDAQEKKILMDLPEGLID